MSFFAMLYTVLISPLKLLFEVIFSIAYSLIGNAGLSIIVLSIAVNFLVLPLYKRADELQAEEREIQAKMAYRIKRTKQTFKGNERFYMLQEYYRINHYKPVYALKSSASLLLQIPFFIAAYNLLSGMQLLKGMSFGFIPDLGKEDALFSIGSFPINILPILMTLINVISGILYTKGHSVKEKVQIYGLALVFLVLLYHSPSGLVFYWLLNNVFSLVKNIFYKLKDPKKALSILLAIAGAAILLLTWTRGDLDMRQKALLSIGCLLLMIPFISRFIPVGKALKERPKDPFTFFSGSLLMALITGLFIPATVIMASSEEFINVKYPSDPALYILYSFCIALGTWVLWGGIFYFFMSDKVKHFFSEGIWVICGVSVANFLTAGTDLGILSSNLQYKVVPHFALSEYLINTAFVVGLTVVFIFIFKKFRTLVRIILIAGIVAVLAFSIWNIRSIRGTYRAFRDRYTVSEEAPSIPLSKTGKNVIVLMLDRAIGPEVPYIFNEKPELKEQFDGFTYYPNTISFGGHTNLASPALYGGYDYAPARLNQRDTELLEDKHNEALRVMPSIFGDNGYDVTICDPPYAGYSEISDLSIFSDHPDFHCYHTNGYYNYFEDTMSSESYTGLVNDFRERNFFCFSLMKISPVLLQETIYDGGAYNFAGSSSSSSGSVTNASDLVQKKDAVNKTATGYDFDFLNSYPVLTHLSEMTDVKDDSTNTFLMMANTTTHSPCLLQEPDYTPALNVDNTAFDTDMVTRYTVNGKTMDMTQTAQIIHYHVNMAAYIELGKWFDYLRENGVYDNTRIILVSDHGYGAGHFNIKYHDGDLYEDFEYFLPLLMVKDFGATGFTVSDEFMTNADTPVLATSDLISDPKNPYTGAPISSEKKAGPQLIMSSDCWDVSGNNGTRYLPAYWFLFEGDPYDPECWKYLGVD